MKYIFPLIGLLLILSVRSIAQTYIDNKQPKVAVVLSGGGAKGFAHIGVLKILEDEGIPIDIIVGTSMGSLIGGFYSLGYTAEEIEKTVRNQDWEKLLSDNVDRKNYSFNEQIIRQRYLLNFSFSDVKSIGLPQGIIKGQNILGLFCGLSGNLEPDIDFNQLPISYASVAADLETGKEVVINKGFFPTALFASMAIPGAFHPMNRDGLLLVDGGIVNNFPTDVAKRMGADIIIGVDIRGPLKPKEELTSVDGIFNQMVGFLGQEKDSVNNSLCDIIIRPDITGYSVSSFTREAVDTLVLRGKKQALAQQLEIRELKKKFNLNQHQYSREYVVKDTWEITDVDFKGQFKLDKTFLKDKLHLDIPGNYSGEQIQNAIDLLYGDGGFDLIYYYLTDNINGKTLHLDITPRKVFSQRIGFKVNTNDAAALLFNLTRKNYEKTIAYLSLSSELSVNPGISFIAETNKKNLPTLGAEIKSKYQNYRIYKDGDKLSSADIFYSALHVYLYKSYFNQLKFRLGMQEEYFTGDVFSKNINSTILPIKDEQFNTNAYAYISFDNLDHFYFPHKGTQVDVEFSINSDLAENKHLSPALLFKMKNVIPLSHNTTLLFNVYSRSIFDNDYSRIKTTLVGGESYSQYFNYHLPFVGLPPVTLADRFTNIGLVGIRFQVAKIQYISVLYNLMIQGSDYSDLDNFISTSGGGIKYSMNSKIGPIDVGIGYANKYDKPTFSANLGFWF